MSAAGAAPGRRTGERRRSAAAARPRRGPARARLPGPAALPVLGALLAVLAAGCSGSGAPGSLPPAPGSGPDDPVATADYLPGLSASLRLPAARGAAPLVVIVPGGSWRTADPTGLQPLARALTAAGASTSTVTYGTSGTGEAYPRPVEDVACAVRWSAARVRAAGRPPSAVVVLGHSAGAQLAALVALAGDRFGAGCPSPAAAVDGLVGLAGPYDVARAADIAVDLFGAPREEAPGAWREGNPLTWVDHPASQGLRVLLVHGDADDVVPPSFTTDFARLLRAAGHPVALQVLPGVDHGRVYAADVAAEPVLAWMRAGGLLGAGVPGGSASASPGPATGSRTAGTPPA